MREGATAFARARAGSALLHEGRVCGPPRRRRLIGAISAVLLLAAVAWTGSALGGVAVQIDFTQRMLAPGAAHPFGTDWMGRDMLARTLAGLSTSLGIGIVAAAVSSVVAVALACAAAFGGRRVDAAVSWLIDAVMGVPHLILIILISYALGRGPVGVVVGVAVTHWPSLARVLRSEIMQVRDEPFLACSEALGVSRARILLTHVAPHIAPQYLVGLVLLFPHAILHEASCTFLGFGLPPEQPAIGSILSEAMVYLSSGCWWLAVFPGAALLACVGVFQALGTNVRGFLVDSAGLLHVPADGGQDGLERGAAPVPAERPDGRRRVLLEVEDLRVSFLGRDAAGEPVESAVLRGITLDVRVGEVLAVIGASGAGKTVLADALLGLYDENERVSGRIRFDGVEMSAEALAGLRGRGIAPVPQGVDALDPLMPLGAQVRGAARRTAGLSRAADARRRRALQRELFERYGFSRADERLYPHQLSGGMARRALLMCALVEEPRLLVADEPTPGLDASLVEQALDDLAAFAASGGAVMLITHDISSALRIADRVAVVESGRVVEIVPTAAFADPSLLRHPYSRVLWHAMPAHGMVCCEGGEGR